MAKIVGIDLGTTFKRFMMYDLGFMNNLLNLKSLFVNRGKEII